MTEEEAVKILCNDVLGITLEEAMQLDEIELKKLLTVNVITPNGENVELGYADISYLYLYPTSQSGNYKFKATNSKGRSSEITVSTSVAFKTFTLEISETETKTFSFIEGQTWNDFIGEDYEKVIDGVEFSKSGESIRISQESTTGYIQKSVKIASLNLNKIKIGTKDNRPMLFLIDGENKIPVSLTDKIVADGLYVARQDVWFYFTSIVIQQKNQ